MSNSDFDRYDWMFTSPLIKKDRVESLEGTKSSTSTRRSCTRKTTKDSRINKVSSKPVVTHSREMNDEDREKNKKSSKNFSTSKIQRVNSEDTYSNRPDRKTSPAPSKKRKAALSTDEESMQFVEPDTITKSPKPAKKSCVRNLPEIPTDQIPIFKSTEFVAEASNIIHSRDIIIEFNNDNKDKKRYYEDFCRPKAKNHDEEYRKSMKYEGILEVKLEHPGSEVQERYLVAECIGHRNKDEYRPIDDLLRTVKIIVDTMLSPEVAEKFENPDILLKKEKSTKKGNIERRLDRAKNRGNFDDFVNAINIFNQYLQEEKKKGGFLSDHVINPDPNISEYRQLIHHIVQQVYDRVVAPHVDLIKKGRGKSEDYGELLPPFVDDIIEKTKMNRDSIFFDLGSGVGNVLLQVAAQVGCDVYGVEINDARYQISTRQSKEFLARCNLYGIKPGKVTIAKIDLNSLSKNRDLFECFKKASVVLVNNLNFSPELNFLLSNLFLDLPPTSQIVSLLSFGGSVTETKRSDLIAVENVNVVAYQENWVSWTHRNGYYFIQTRINESVKEEKKKKRKRD